MAQLTERQQQIKGLLEQGKRAEDIGKALGITTNAVYQQIRRMRKGGSRVTTPTGGGGSKAAKAGRKSGRKAPSLAGPAAPKPAPAPAAPQPTTPLQAVRARRDEIHAHTRKAKGEVEAAERALTAAKAQAEKVEGRFKEELKALDKAEAALRPQPAPAPKPAAAKSTAKKSGAKGQKASPPKPAAAAPAAPPAPTPPAPATPPEAPQGSANGAEPQSAPQGEPQEPVAA